MSAHHESSQSYFQSVIRAHEEAIEQLNLAKAGNSVGAQSTYFDALRVVIVIGK